ncbi:amidohydrolase [Mediterraneibacter catenae]|uniref:Amidohydrolase n=1 Tax=Mediterraneibacter catenae TaxID=2594882 RepID=A0A5M9I1U7_9FIRM|nr:MULTISPECIES: amidohydrolase [Mediterraneibacter]KAA8501709.1 amidohydrolase [Mediterraneibacter catenae]MCF2568887.1 amidohydrolase [Mediterraneibacter glycyrrhizinilyticus]MDN0045270.1 amidohydrolase [Mediterraneibacter glycyrrhizinilyticus]
MRTRIYNARILTMEDGAEIFRGEIQIEDGKISSVMSCDDNNGTGRKHDVIWDEEIDACGNLIMPGFKNAHTHSPMTFLRSYADDMKLQEWLYDKVFPAEAELTEEDIYWLTKLAIMEYLTSGITSSFDMYKLKHETARASEETGFRMVLCGDINDFGGTAQDVENDYLKYNKDKDSLISYQMGFHAEYTTSRELMESLAETADRHQAPVCVHCSETKKEVEECRERSGMSPVAYMDSLGLFRHGGVLFHGVHMDDSDFDIIKNHGIYVVTNPASNLKLASGIAPVKRYLELGIPVAIGTDGPASNNCLDMFREMFLVTGLQKVMCDDPEAVPARDVLKMAVTNGAHAMGLTDCDAIAPGKRADLIMIDLSQPNMQPLHNIEKNIVYSASKQNVKMTMIGGRILYQDGEFRIGETKEDIYQNANRIAERILGK